MCRMASYKSRLASLGAICALTFASQTAAQWSPVSGETLFKQRCTICHSVVKDKPASVGPNLSGVVGRKAGTTAFAYSAALKASAIIWTKPKLDMFLAMPSKTVPGTRMVMSVSDAKQRSAIIDFLGKAK